MPKYYRNETLFSEIYLEEITRQEEDAQILASLNVLNQYRDYADTSSLDAWKDSYVNEVLSALGFHIQPASDHLIELYPMGSASDYPSLSLCYVLLPDENLDNTTMGRNWAEKIIRALREHGLQWGLLTNGKHWRIYHQDEPMPYETYLEMDLESILNQKAQDAYQIFYKFMKHENFVAREDGKRQFDQFKKESQDKIDYIEEELANALRQREEGGKGVLSDLCMGYVDQLRTTSEGAKTNLDDEALRQKIYHAAMLYMFRLLFLFYADARRLLSEENHELLEAVIAQAQAYRNDGNAGPNSISLWQRLETIFVNIDQSYNGGLFSPQESEVTTFLSDIQIADVYLTGAIFNLTTYREKNGEQKPISYRDMSVRHLGTLYEGLLEHKLFIAKEDTEVKVSKGKIKFIPVSQGGKLAVGHYIKAGEVYFAGDPSERKSSGSYYTPEYIVDYIVRNTVGEKLKALKAAFADKEKATLSALQLAVDEIEQSTLKNLLEENLQGFVSGEVLQLSVLDPAMGSGHFLVNATNLISNFITDFLNEHNIEGNLESGTPHWRRWVVENCIYGVDLNPLAVELAKLSLWILSMAKDQPLSFLNHHLKCGNSLVGARLEEVGNYPFSTTKKEPQQLSLFERDPDFKSAVEEAILKSRLIAAKGSTTLEDVREKRTWLESIEQVLQGYKSICNVHTGLYFGNEVDEPQYNEMVKSKDFILAESLDNVNQYFHWELEFPEICISRGGFSCIVCNPPYDTFKEDIYFSEKQASGTGNLFAHFIANVISINADYGYIGFVVPLSFACGSSFETLRKFVYKNYQELHASHYSKRPNMLFDGVQQRITIFYALGKSYILPCVLHSSKLWRWQKSDQEYVVRNPNHTYVGQVKNGIIPKIHTKIGADIYRALIKAPLTMGDLFSTKRDNKKHIAYYHSVSMYWIKAYSFIPHFQREGDPNKGVSSKLKTVYFDNVINKRIFLLLMNSPLFYYWWITISNEFDVQVNEVRNFGIYGYDQLVEKHNEVSGLVDELMADYQKNSVIKSTSLGGRRAEYQEFYPRKSVQLINEISDFLSPIYGLSEQQNYFLKNFDLEWRTDKE